MVSLLITHLSDLQISLGMFLKNIIYISRHYTVSQKKLNLLALDHLRRSNFFWDTMYYYDCKESLLRRLVNH